MNNQNFSIVASSRRYFFFLSRKKVLSNVLIFRSVIIVFLFRSMTLKGCRKYSRRAILEASLLVKNLHCSIRQASLQSGVSYSSLRSCCLNGSNKQGRRPVFNNDQKEQLVYFASFRVRTIKQFLEFAFERSKSWKIKVPASWVKNKAAGRRWMLDFLTRFDFADLFVKNSQRFFSETFFCRDCDECFYRENLNNLCGKCLNVICIFCSKFHKCSSCNLSAI